MLRRVLLGITALFVVVPVFTQITHAASDDLVLTAAHVVDMHGHWSRVADPSADGGFSISSPDSGWQNTAGPSATPLHYVDFTFTPEPDVAYRVWLRLKATDGSKYNDSVFVQFSNARDTRGYARYGVGTTQGLLVNRQSCGGCAQNGWGWYDGAYWLTQPSVLRFAAGSQTLRVQTREDGVEIDQIVLSPVSYLSTAPGAKDWDTTIVTGAPDKTSGAFTGTALSLPGVIAADAFDEGAAGVAYHDTTLGNDGSVSRTTNVDLMPLADGRYAVTGIDAGEWLNYRVSVAYAAEYILEIDAASAANGGKFHVDANGVNLTGVLEIPNTGSVSQFTTITQPVTLPAGTYTLKVIFDSKAANTAIAAIRVVRPRSSYTGANIAIPGTVSAIEFDNGGQGWSWLDSTPGNAGNAVRTTDVDIFGNATGGYYIADTVAGEWVEYTVDVAQAGNYVVRFEAAAMVDGAQLSAHFAGASTASIPVPNTGNLTSWTKVAGLTQLTAGAQYMRVAIEGGGLSLRSISVEPAPTFTTFNVPAGGDLQAAIDAAVPGDLILLEPGATYLGNFTLPAKNGDAYITIRSSAADALLPNEHTRITPEYATLLPKLRSPNTQPALSTEPYAHHYRIQFVEFPANRDGYGNIVALGDGSRAQNTLDVVPHHLVFDRVYIHGDVVKGQKRGIALNSASTTIINSYIAEIKAAGQDSQAIGGWNGPGPYEISNNYLEAAGENVMFGGADPAIPDLVPSDITFTRNHLYKPLSWRGTSWTIKNLFELKSAQRVLVDGNVMENNWLAAQTGYAVLLKSVNQDGGAPWSVVQHVTFTNNIVRHVASAINVLGRDWRYPAIEANNIIIRNNLIYDVSGAKYGGSGRFLQINGGIDIVVDHNTVIADGSTAVMADGNPTYGFQFTNNVMKHNAYGIKGSGASVGNGTIAQYFPNGLFVGGLYIGGRASSYPAGNFFPATVDAVPFVDYAGGDYRLSPLSIYLGGASDGSDPGVDYAAIAGVFVVAQ